MKTAKFLTMLFVSLLFCSNLSAAGDLNPPTAPTTGTMKTLGEVEPRSAINSENTPGDPNSTYKISQPGSYYLTANFTSNFKHGILIDADDVRVDLMGFRIYSSWLNVTGSLEFDGIHIGAGCNNIKICNGTITSNRSSSGIFSYRGFRYGIYSLADSDVKDISIADMHIIGSRNDGIHLDGTGICVESCNIQENDFSGIYVGDDSVVSNCNLHNNCSTATEKLYGIRTGNSSTVTQCNIYENGDSVTCTEFHGIYAGEGCIISNNKAHHNGDSAIAETFSIIYAYGGSTVTKNTVYENLIFASGNSLCIGVSTGGTITHNTVHENGEEASGGYCHGISSGIGCTISGNTVSVHGYSSNCTFVYGIGAGMGSTVTDNTAYFNGRSASYAVCGIWLAGYNLVDQNTAYENGVGAGGSISNMRMSATGCVYGNNVAP